MGKKATILFDIQHNTSEFNISHHMEQVIAIALIANTLKENENTWKEIEKECKRAANALERGDAMTCWAEEAIIGHIVAPVVEYYLHSEMGTDEEYYEEEKE